MTGNARHVTAAGPTPVSVHNDRNVPGKTRRIEPQINVSLFAVHASRNRVSQVKRSESKLTHEI